MASWNSRLFSASSIVSQYMEDASEDRASSGTVCLPCCLRQMLMHTFLVILVASRLKSRGCSMRSRKSHSRSRDSCTTSSASASLCRKSLASRSRLFRCCVAISMYVSVVISIGITHLRPNVMQFFAFTAPKKGMMGCHAGEH